VPDVIVVGGGIIGCATAYYLAKHGSTVTLLERASLASEASGASAGMLAALSDEGGDRGPDFQRFCLDGLRSYESLLPELEATGVDIRYRRAGVLHIALNEQEAGHLKARLEAQRGIAPDSRWLSPAELAREEPDVSRRAVVGLLAPSEHYVDSQRVTIALAEAAKRHGASIRESEAVTRFHSSAGALTGVTTASGRYDAGAVVLAGGSWTAAMARSLGANIPVRPVRGQMLSLRGPTQPLRHVIWGANGYLVPREDGQTFVGATVEEAGYRKVTTLAAQRLLRRVAMELVPTLRGATQLRAWAGLRPASSDGLPIMGLLPGWSNAWVSTGHFRNGILLAAISGQLVAHSVLAGKPDAILAPFSPTRFAGEQVSAVV
jgi:glycine oxidase